MTLIQVANCAYHMKNNYEVAVIGAGPGGYVAAIRCAQLGLATICIDEWRNAKKEPSPGGTCLNVGCIPSKALLESSENYERAMHKFAAHGIRIEGVQLDLAAMMARKDAIVHQLTSGILTLLRKNKVDFLHGHASLLDNKKEWRIEVKLDGDTSLITAKHVIIATGSTPAPLAGAPFDYENVVSSTQALEFPEVPQRMAIIGIGAVGLELGSMWRRLGSEVTLLKPREGFLPNVDEKIAREAQRALTRQGLVMHMGLALRKVNAGKKQVTMEYEDKEGAHQLEVDKLAIAAGRLPNTAWLGEAKAGLKLDPKGFIEVDQYCRTNLPDVYAIGDVVRGPMLAHKAAEEGVAVAERIAGQAGQVNYELIPSVIYTSPEIAWIGKTEQELKQAGVPYIAAFFPYGANGRAQALGETEGMVKLIAHRDTDRILGVHIFGPLASESIAEAVVAMEFGASSEDIARIMHAHPSLSEAMREAALGAGQRPIHI